MTWSLTDIYRHPVKSLGQEALDHVTLSVEQPMPHDRKWAIAHGGADWDPAAPHWIGGSASVVNQAHVPRLAQITTRYDESVGELHLAHPDLDALVVNPSDSAHHDRLTAWVEPLLDGTRRTGPFQVCEAPGVAFTDFEDTHISIATGNSLRELEGHAGIALEHIRFRMNLWLDGPPAFSELDWVDREVEIGEVGLKVIARDARCSATNASPLTGERDTQLPGLLQRHYGHMDFGVYARVSRGGEIRRGDGARLL